MATHRRERAIRELSNAEKIGESRREQITHIRERMDSLEPLQDQIKILKLGQEALLNQKADKIDIGAYPRVPLIILNIPLDKRFTESMKVRYNNF